MNFFKNKREKGKGQSGFTLIELLLGSSIMLIVILATLALYVQSNKVSVDQQQFAEVQHDVRSGMYFISRDIRMAGVGLSLDVSGYFLEGHESFGPNPEISDTIRLLGNFDDSLALRIRQYQWALGTASLYDYELDNAPYDCPGFYENKIYLIISTTYPGCYTYLLNNLVQCGIAGTGQQLGFQAVPGQPELNPPGGLVDLPWCGANCWDDAIITFGQIKFYWLDTTGDPNDYAGLGNLDVNHGYLSVPNVLYVTTNDPAGVIVHMPLAMNIENLQFEYNGDFDNNDLLDGFRSWDNANWTILPGDNAATRQTKGDLISRITEVKMWILGRTPRPFLTVGQRVPANLDLYRRPRISNSPRADHDDLHRRFLLESTSNIRNLSMTIYNTGDR